MPHMPEKRYVVVSCHVERLLDDACWAALSAFRARRPGGLAVAALLRPPDLSAREDEALWLRRARESAALGPLGHHTHFVAPEHARPEAAGPEHAERVRGEAAWLREQGFAARIFCGGGWYLDEGVAGVLAELGYADCTATAFRPAYLQAASPRLAGEAPARLALAGGGSLLELPTTHSLGMAVRAALAPGPQEHHMHVYFHDTDLLVRSRALALSAALAVLARRREATDLERLADAAAGSAPRAAFSSACAP
jgi:hypothetical protein